MPKKLKHELSPNYICINVFDVLNSKEGYEDLLIMCFFLYDHTLDGMTGQKPTPEIIKWLYEYSIKWDFEVDDNDVIIYFTNTEDMLLFKLTWL